MAQSKDFPDLRFVLARAYGKGRDGKGIRVIVIHYTAGSERSTSAEDGASYDQRRTDGTSTHFFHDRDSTIQCVLLQDRANAARHRGNRIGIQHELCGSAQTRAQWLDAASEATLRQAAKQVARECKMFGIPARRLTVSETRRAWTEYPDGPRGIVGHVDCTKAFPEDLGDHTDPGKDFPWDVFLDMVRDEMTPAPPQEDTMAISDDDATKIARAVLNAKLGRSEETVGQDLQDDDAPAIEVLNGKLDRVLAILDPIPPTPPA